MNNVCVDSTERKEICKNNVPVSTMKESTLHSTALSSCDDDSNNLPEYILNALYRLWNIPQNNGNGEAVFRIVQVPLSAQQKVWILRVPQGENAEWQPALKEGNHHIVIRLWKSSCNWWNCNYQPDPEIQRLATSEAAAYRIAHRVLSHLRIPRVLHFESEQTLPWAIFEYVDSQVCATSFLDSMIPVRHEFGFDEPHPRWGRLPVESCHKYGDLLMQQVVIPLHRQWWQSPQDANGLIGFSKEEPHGLRYLDMIRLYQDYMRNVLLPVKDLQESFLQHAILLLQQIIMRLDIEAKDQGIATVEDSSSSLPCVPCHMDLQPQNLIFTCSCQSTNPDVLSVLDWEDAAYADCRFELLLVGRKVMANQQQADRLWKAYEVSMGVTLGPIEPWLRLETTHSLTTLVLQAVAGGGRNSWEQLEDIQQKFVRECQRLAELGWEFCSCKGFPSQK